MKGSVISSAFILLILIFYSCKKEDSKEKQDKYVSPKIKIIGLDENEDYYQFDTIPIEYVLNDFEYDSICLLIEGEVVQTQITSQNEFNYIADSTGSFEITLAVYHNKKTLDTDDRNIKVVKSYNIISFILKCFTLDGGEDCFVGDELIIYLEPRYEIGWDQIQEFKEFTMYLNGIDLGTKYSPPFDFEAGVVNQAENTVEFKMVDKENHICFEELQLTVPVNTPPQIEYEYKYQYGVILGYFYSVDSIIFNTNGYDNVNIHYVEYYVDGNLCMTDSINSEYIQNKKFNAGLLSAGEHTSYCVAYDNRGESTTTETLSFMVYGAVQIDQDMVDLERTDNENVVYAITGSALFKINPVNENVEEQFSLPFQDATCMKYVGETNRLYIGFQGGQLVYFDELSSEFTTVLSSAIPDDIVDLEIDHALNRAIVVASEKILLFDLSTNSIKDEFSSSEVINSLAVDTQNKIIIACANPHSSGGYLYKLDYNSSTITLNQQKYETSYPLEILFKKNNNVFTVLSYFTHGFTSYFTSDLSEAGTYSEYNAGTGCYSYDGNYFYMDNNFDDLIDFCYTSDYSIFKTCYIPLDSYNGVEFMTTNADDSKLVILTDNTFYSDVKLVFIDL